MTVQKESINEENKPQQTIQSVESKGECLVSNRCSRELDPEHALISRSAAVSSCRELCFPNALGFEDSVPKNITPSDEKYVLRCLELIRDYALKTEAWTLTSKVHISPDDLASCDFTGLGNECPLVNSSGEWTLGNVMDSPSMINILKSPLLRKDASELFPYNVEDIKHKLISSMSDKPRNEATVVKTKHVSMSPVHRRVVSVSSTNSSCSDQSSSSASATSCQGMLRCTWNNGVPHHVFSMDDEREVYISNCYKVEDKALDYIYSFHSRRTQEKDLDSREPVAMMRVSTSISFRPDNTEVRETQFLLSVSDNDTDCKLQVSNRTNRKNKTSTRKSGKQRSFSKFPGSSAILEDAPWDPFDDVHGSINPLEAIAERGYTLNHELAAIVVKEISKNCRDSDTGGWGLRFLKKSSEHLPSKFARNTEECSTSMDILIPAGLHGGPKPRGGGSGSGSSSLIERWISGGNCDCGGWDIGCPLTVLSTQSGSLDALSSHADNSWQCKSVDLFIKGSRVNVPVLKMANIHEGLFYIHFQPSLSSLQSFAIAAAMIHSGSPLLRV